MIRPLLILFLASTLSAAAQGPLDGYLKGTGILDLAPSFSFNSARRFDGADNQTFNTPYRGNMLSLFGEYGVSKKLDLVATAAVVFTENRSGLQDGGLFMKYRPFYKETGKMGRLGVLFGTGASFPLSDYEPATTGALGQKALIVPARLIVQWETPLGIFVNLSGGYNWRLDNLQETDIAAVRRTRPNYQPVDPQDFSTILFKVGLPAKHYYLDAWVERQFTSGGADYVENVADLPQAYGVSYTQIGGTAFYAERGRNGVYLSGGYILEGRNVSRILRVTLGAVLKIGGR